MQSLCVALGFFGVDCDTYDNSLKQKFLDHVSTYGLSYGTTEEMMFRLDQFARSDKFIQESNANPAHHYVSGHNKFSTWTESEFKAMLGKKETINHDSKFSEVFRNIPAEVDWTKVDDVVNPV